MLVYAIRSVRCLGRRAGNVRPSLWMSCNAGREDQNVDLPLKTLHVSVRVARVAPRGCDCL